CTFSPNVVNHGGLLLAISGAICVPKSMPRKSVTARTTRSPRTLSWATIDGSPVKVTGAWVELRTDTSAVGAPVLMVCDGLENVCPTSRRAKANSVHSAGVCAGAPGAAVAANGLKSVFTKLDTSPATMLTGERTGAAAAEPDGVGRLDPALDFPVSPPVSGLATPEVSGVWIVLVGAVAAVGELMCAPPVPTPVLASVE